MTSSGDESLPQLASYVYGILAHTVSLSIGIYVLRKHWTFLEAFTVSYLLTAINGGFWEIPIIVLTCVQANSINLTYALHLASFAPLLFLIPLLQYQNSKLKAFQLVIIGFGASILCMILVLPYVEAMGFASLTIDIQHHLQVPDWIEWIWVVNRIVCYLSLIGIVKQCDFRANIG